MKATSSILIIRMSALGDVAMTIPVIYSLASQYPQLTVYVLTRPFHAQLFLHAPSNIRLVTLGASESGSSIKGTFKLIRKLYDYPIDCVADFHNVLRSWIIDLAYLCKGKKVSMVHKCRLQRYKATKGHQVQESYIDRYTDTLTRLGYPIHNEFISLFADQCPVLPLTLLPNGVGVAPFARYKTKTYPLPLMEEVVRLLRQRHIPICLFGAKGKEASLLEEWSRKYECTVIAGRFTLAEELSLMSQLSVMLAMDSANQHLAALAGIPSVTLWGSTTPACGFKRYQYKQAVIDICLSLPCQPCSIAGRDTCPLGHLHCLQDIRPEWIVNQILTFLSSTNH